MKIICLLLSALVVVQAEPLDYDKINIEEITNDLNTLKNFMDCFIDVAPCTEIAAAVKKDIPEVMEDACGTCTNTEKRVVKVFLNSFNTNLPDDYEIFKTKFDPQGTKLSLLEAAVAN